jgi:hypothetical protein
VRLPGVSGVAVRLVPVTVDGLILAASEAGTPGDADSPACRLSSSGASVMTSRLPRAAASRVSAVFLAGEAAAALAGSIAVAFLAQAAHLLAAAAAASLATLSTAALARLTRPGSLGAQAV